KCEELSLLSQALNETEGGKQVELDAYSAPIRARKNSTRVNNLAVAERLAAIKPQDSERNQTYPERAKLQRQRYNLPLWPTTTIGSFP
ncbi:5-methyltetrahydropteroyltriglutamate--homocysteine S-methyltransferase, partial [Xenorhabdus bovienii]|nr:5-methyltetrahydropteroyltriglutamate--homocysteine S-methyltransferase [Xenorhabdus bovienii]